MLQCNKSDCKAGGHNRPILGFMIGKLRFLRKEVVKLKEIKNAF